MKNKISTLSMTMALFAMSSCSDDVPATGSGTPVGPGVEIQFGASLVSPSDNSRTYYGKPGTNVWPIYWNANTANLDHIFVYSPQANGSRNQANYTVHPDASYPNQAANITKDGAFGVQTGSDETAYDFYGIYPATAVTAPATGGTGTSNPAISATLPGDQTVTFTGTVDPAGTEDATTALVPAEPASGANYYTKPDMKACLMYSANKSVDLTKTPIVNLPFHPLSSCIDLTISGPETNATTGETTATITSVIFKSKSGCLSGGFTFDNDPDHYVIPVNRADSAAHTVTIPTMFLDKDGDMVGVPLRSGNTLRLQAFILPDKEITDLSVSIVTSDFKTRSFDLKVNNGLLRPGQIHPVISPIIDLEEGTVDYSIWLSQLDPRIYISELSLPGSVFSYSTRQYEDASGTHYYLNNTQSLSIREQFNAGIRVFQTHCALANQTSSIDGKATSLGISVKGNSITDPNNSSRILTVGDMIKELFDEMENTHSNEFCVLLLSDYEWTSNNDLKPAMNWTNFFSRIKDLLGSEQMSKYIVTDFGPNKTIGDIKGRILVKFVPNYNNSSAVSAVSLLNGCKALFNAWQTGMTSSVYYSPLKWATTVGINDNNTTSSSNTPNPMLFVHTEQANPVTWHIATPAWNSDWEWNETVSEQITGYHNKYSSDTHDVFGLTFLGGNGYNYRVTRHEMTTAGVAQHFNAIWTNAVNRFSDDKPYGWVLFNCVGSEPTTNTAIGKVIGNNVKQGYKLNRDRNKNTPQRVAPNGDTQGTNHGGSIFGN